MSMSKKDFIALADAIREHNRIAAKQPSPELTPFNYEHLDTLADFMARQNGNFKRDRWLEYVAGNCGPNGGAIKDKYACNCGVGDEGNYIHGQLCISRNRPRV